MTAASDVHKEWCAVAATCEATWTGLNLIATCGQVQQSNGRLVVDVSSERCTELHESLGNALREGRRALRLVAVNRGIHPDPRWRDRREYHVAIDGIANVP